MFEWYKKKITYKHAPNTEKLFKHIANTVSSTIANWPGYERIAEKIENIPQKEYDNIYKSYVPQEGAFNVITHGDMYINNLLFRYDANGKPVDIRLVSIKLHHFLVTPILLHITFSIRRLISSMVSMQVQQTICFVCFMRRQMLQLNGKTVNASFNIITTN